MALSDLTTNAVLRALAQFDELGREAFLQRYGFRRARGYFVLFNGNRYDSKAIAGAAHGFVGPKLKPLTHADFSGGEKTVAKRLRKLGFTVTEPSEAAFEALPFKEGALYHRQRDIHEVYGGQERGGIATPEGTPYVFLFTGETGGQYGYSDGWRPEGVFAYTGEGQRGNMEFIRGNRAIRDHIADGKDLLLFEAAKTKGLYRFLGCFACAGWEMHDATDADRAQRKAIVFHLVPVSEVETVDPEEAEDLVGAKKSLEEMRRLAHAAAALSSTPPKDARRNYYTRSAAVKLYVLERAGGRCEVCGKQAPFVRKDGTPYLEPHHTRRIADGGPDHPSSVGAVCPTCHREIHHGRNGSELNARLEQKLMQLEAPAPDDCHAVGRRSA
jgi:5-methylcytosine-specific restriction protein A